MTRFSLCTYRKNIQHFFSFCLEKQVICRQRTRWPRLWLQVFGRACLCYSSCSSNRGRSIVSIWLINLIVLLIRHDRVKLPWVDSFEVNNNHKTKWNLVQRCSSDESLSIILLTGLILPLTSCIHIVIQVYCPCYFNALRRPVDCSAFVDNCLWAGLAKHYKKADRERSSILQE